MTRTFVIVDVETTGLDARQDAIIEIGAIVLRENDIVDQFSSLVNPFREIPSYVTRLTGITQAMVEDAPSMHVARKKLRPLLADHVIVGHNVDFDMGFLEMDHLGVGNHRVDTLTLASILAPEAGRYGLDSLSRFLDLPAPDGGQTHRAFDDAEQTVELFLTLKERAVALEMDVLEEIVAAGRQMGWPEAIFFEEALALKARDAFTGKKRRHGRRAHLFNPEKIEGKPLKPVDKLKKLDVELVAAMLEPDGNFARTFPGFEYRPQQVEMLTAVVHAFNDAQQTLVEAGTGTGKSLAYLIPASFWAHENGRRVIITTNTINLQDQLIGKDIPGLQQALPFELRAAVRKGRSNYLCTRLFRQMRHRGPANADEMTLFARILGWLPRTQSGDVAELSLRTGGERMAWSKVNAENATCTGDQCAEEGCPLHMARLRSERAHLLIINHALLLANAANESMILPEFVDLIIDEAHHLESAVTDGLSFRADKRYLESVLDDIIGPDTGLLADLLKQVGAGAPAEVAQEVNARVMKLRQTAVNARPYLDEFFMAIQFFLQDQLSARSKYAQQIRLTTAVRSQPDYDEVEIAWDHLGRYLEQIEAGFVNIAEGLEAALEDMEEGDDLRLTLTSQLRTLNETRINLNTIISDPKDGRITWVEVWKERISLHAAPLEVGPLVEEHIFGAKETVILTSATLRTANIGSKDGPTFDYIQSRLHAGHTADLAVGSPFDYKNSTLLYLVTDMPEPNQPGYQRYVEDAIVDIATALGGRTMALFTSYGQLNQTAKAIEERLAGHDITLLAQGGSLSRQQLLDQFKQPDGRAALLGTRSFWEGVDVPGDALQAVLLVKLPFDVPSDPIYAARSETFDSPFFEYSIPETALRFRQGFGRLIRRQDDEGIVVILDKRVLSKRYGQMFLDALPECTVLRQRHGRIGELTIRWLNREKTP
ncbi:MAG: helicase C-terminal domain-containing protein [Anaerolineae bacterium]